MPRGKNNRGKVLFLDRFFREFTDQDHPATMEQILSWLEEHDIQAERKGIYEDLEFLSNSGTDIRSVRIGRSTGYYLGRREFELSELKLLVDAVQSSQFITENKSLSLIGRLEKLGSTQQAKQLRRQVWVRGRIKTMNESVFNNVDRINAAIEADCRIMFRYFTWDRSKNRVFRRDGKRYTVSPWAFLLDSEKYYLLAFEDGMMKHFRVDKMLDIRVTDRPREGKEDFAKLDMASYTDSHFGMFSGENTPVKLLFDNRLAGVAVDQFGRDAMLIPEGEEHFSVTVNVAVNAQFYGWLTGLGDQVRILSPQSAADGMRAHLASIQALYPPFGSLLSVYDSLLFVDTETTGFDSETDHITEFAAIKVTRAGQESYRTFVRLPEGVSIPENLVAMTGITDEMCASGISTDDLRSQFLELLDRKTLLIAYNAQFDASFLTRLTGEALRVDYLDSLTVYRDRARAPHRLSDAIAHYRVYGRNSHRAMDDAEALLEVTKAMEAEKNDLLSYINRFGYKAKYGIGGKQIEGITYFEQEERMSV